ncbi:MAG: serine/threonine protein kinase [Planctomycetota bacterium]|nr:MAG: serine/threonine protein kinase [Planctomycetota bacterium]
MSEPSLAEPDLSLGLLAIRNEFVNLSELRHCVDVRKKIFGKTQQELGLGEVLVQQRYLTPQDLEYLRMLAEAEPVDGPVDMARIEAEFEQHVAELKPGSVFGNYRMEEEIGRGGMGIVFRAADLENDEEDVALKILIGGKDATVRDIERFKKEATVMAPLLHPGIVKILEVGRHKGLDFISMEFIDGVSLKELVGDKPLSDEMALLVIRSAAEAVAFMHSHGIIHRDIKPENIMARHDGSSVLMDFGLAGWDKIEILAGRGSIGTPMYQPPEQADVGGPFGKISPASDVYGLGATLYYILTARHPFLGKSVKEVREKIKKRPPDPIRQINPKVHAATEALCLRCLRKRQGERFPTPKALIENIDKVLGLLLTEDPAGERAMVRLQRRVAGASRRRSEAGGKAKTGKGKAPKNKSGKGRVGPRPRNPSERSKLKSGAGKLRSGAGKVPRSKAVARGRSGRSSQRQPTGSSTNQQLWIVLAAVGLFLVLAVGVLVVASGS